VATAGASRRLVVRGIVQFLYDARDQQSIAVTLPLARAMTGPQATDRASVVLVRTVGGADVEAVAARLAAAWPEVQVAGTAALRRQFEERLTYFRQLSLVLASIALAVTVLLIGTLLTITVNERMVEIATLRAIGVSRASVVRQVVAHGALLVVGGTILGTGLGLVTARWLDRILTSFPGLPASVSFFVPTPRSLLLGAAVLLLSGLCAGAWPAWRAASAPLTLTLREDGA
jgi:ABC-type lipoprotein release transport system permease subunit